MLVDHADQHRFLVVGVRAGCFDLRTAVAEGVGDVRNNFFLIGSDNCKFVGGLGAFQHQVAHKGGNEAVENAQSRRLVVQCAVRVDEDGCDGNNAVKHKGYRKEIGIRADLIDIPGNDICSAGGSVVPETDPVHHTGADTAEDHRVDGVVSQGVILNKSRVNVLQKQEGNGIDHRKQQGLYRKILLH